MRAFSYARSLPVMWQRWRSYHSIGHSQKPHAACKVHGSMFYRTGVMADGSFTLRVHAFWTLFAPVTFTLTRSPSYMNLTHIPWRYTRYVKMKFLYQVFPKLSYYSLRMSAFGHAWSLPITRWRWQSQWASCFLMAHQHILGWQSHHSIHHSQ